jgi:hypothetical protein
LRYKASLGKLSIYRIQPSEEQAKQEKFSKHGEQKYAMPTFTAHGWLKTIPLDAGAPNW